MVQMMQCNAIQSIHAEQGESWPRIRKRIRFREEAEEAEEAEEETAEEGQGDGGRGRYDSMLSETAPSMSLSGTSARK